MSNIIPFQKPYTVRTTSPEVCSNNPWNLYLQFYFAVFVVKVHFSGQIGVGQLVAEV
jgi:hypothetical protein